MTDKAHEASVHAVVAADKLTAELVIPPGVDPAALDAGVCGMILQQAGVEVAPPVHEAVQALLETPAQPGQTRRAVVARATPPEHGRDGRVEWLVSEADAEPAAPPDADAPAASYYDHSAFVMVRPGQVIGRIHPPTAASDGRDVTGRTLPARLGRDAAIKLDETILRDGKGQLIAQMEGVLVRDRTSAAIRRVLEIRDYVDFSTGNIDFSGDVTIHKGVRDLFTVKATGNIEVRGLIEAANIHSGADLIAHGGFAGRERGSASVGGNLLAKYLDNVEGEVRGDLKIDREIINCDLVVHGAVESPHGALIGGRIVATGRVVVGTLGSAAGVPTEVVIGSVPRLEPLRESLHGSVAHLEEQKAALVAEKEQLDRLTANGRATAIDKERQTELSFELSNLQRLIDKASPTLKRLTHRLEGQRTIDVLVERRLHPGVTLRLGTQCYQISTELRGPLRICRDAGGALVYARPDGGTIGLLLQVAEVHLAA